MTTLWQDIRYAVRMLARAPGFVALVVGILAIGIAANTALFSVVNAVMLQPLPYRNSDRLVSIWEDGSRWDEGFRARAYFPFLRENNDVFEAVGGWCRHTFYVGGIETPHEVRACEVTANLFSMLGVRPVLGRGFLPEDETPKGRHVVILSHEFWQQHMGGSPDVLGRDITLTAGGLGENNETLLQREVYTVVGVMPADFVFPYRRVTALWRPLVLSEVTDGRIVQPIFPLARLRDGVTRAQADAHLGVLATRLREIAPQAKVQAGKVGVTRLLDELVAGHRKLPLLLLGAAGFVLLIACSNAANLFLARATVRRHEMAMRLALGASRWRVMRQMLTESLLLSLSAGLLGLLLTFATVKTLAGLCPADVPRLEDTKIDSTVLGFTLGISVLTGLLFGMMPAWRAADVSVSTTLKESAGRTSTGRRWRRLHSGLVVSQLALSLILLIGATLLIRSLIGLTRLDLGFQPDRVLAVHVVLPEAKYTEASQYDSFFRSLLDRLRAVPGVDSVGALYNGTGIDETLGATDFLSMDYAVGNQDDAAPLHSARVMLVTAEYFATMGIPFLRGQTFTTQDPGNIVIDEALAHECFGDTNPIGQILRFGGPDGQPLQVVGVVDAVRSFDTPEPGRGVVYGCGMGFGNRFAVVLVRTVGAPTNLAPAIRQQAAALEKDQVIQAMEPLRTTLSRMLAPQRFVMLLLSIFAALALTLATTGIYGLLQYSTNQQTHDIGVHMALGAEQADVRRIILWRGLKLTLVGIGIGIAGTAALTRVLASLLYDVSPTDPAILAGVSIILSGVALSACYVPARRAARIDPMEALRDE